MRATLQYYDPILRMTVLELPYKPFLKLHIRSFLNRLGEGGWHMVIFLQTLVWLCQAMVVGAQFIRAACPTQGSPVLDCAQWGQINSKEAFLYSYAT